jgi:alkylhydroperoxidase/carboxymuconolactone decarboxylase family protein YurZ
MRHTGKQICIGLILVGFLSGNLFAQSKIESVQALTAEQQSIISIAAITAKGDLVLLKPALNKGLEAGLSINEIKEVLVHLYAYCGFPRSIRGLQTFMEVLGERKAAGIKDQAGAEASPIDQEADKYERGKNVLAELTKIAQVKPTSGYGAFAQVIDTFLKEHLFADIFERDVLNYAERELVTISVLSSLGGVEPMLRSHLSICLNVGITPEQLHEFTKIIALSIGEKESNEARIILDEVLNSKPAK